VSRAGTGGRARHGSGQAGTRDADAAEGAQAGTSWEPTAPSTLTASAALTAAVTTIAATTAFITTAAITGTLTASSALTAAITTIDNEVLPG